MPRKKIRSGCLAGEGTLSHWFSGQKTMRGLRALPGGMFRI
jgi:hypothetical protein